MTYDYNEWLKNPIKIFCKCGCGEEIIIKPNSHKYYGIPEYSTGHDKRLRLIPQSYQKWMNNKPKIFCKCGCGKEIIIKSHHKQYGVPEYIRGHNGSLKGKQLSDEHKEKLSLSHKGKNSPNKGKLMSQEIKDKISFTLMGKYCGELHPFYGKHHTEKTKEEMSKLRKREKAYNWQGGKSFEPYCPKFNKQKKEENREKYGRTCYLCGKLESDQLKEMKERGKRPFRLSVHHLDSDKEQGCNGKSWKLVPLCIHCHNSKKMEILNEN